MSWTPPASDGQWFYDHDPLQGPGDDVIFNVQQQESLMQATEDAFGVVERGLSSTAQLASTVAAGLRGVDAQRADTWDGDAADAFHDKLGSLPTQLDQVHDNYQSALSALAAFAASTFDLQAKYRPWQTEMSALRTNAQHACYDVTYPDQTTGEAKINALKTQLNQLVTRQQQIFSWNDDATNTFSTAIEKLAGEAPHPHESELQKILSPITDLWHKVTGTWSAITDFANNPSWKTFDTLTDDIATDASIVVLAVGAPEALAGVGLLDVGADSTLLTVTELTGTAAKGLDAAATAGNVTAKEFDKQYGAGAFEALLVLAPGALDAGKSIAGDTELQQTVGEAKLVAGYKSALDSGESPEKVLAGMPPDEAAALKKIIPKYQDPAAVTAATKKIGGELQAVRKSAGLVEAPKGFVWENGVLVPAAKAAGNATGGSNDGGG